MRRTIAYCTSLSPPLESADCSFSLTTQRKGSESTGNGSGSGAGGGKGAAAAPSVAHKKLAKTNLKGVKSISSFFGKK